MPHPALQGMVCEGPAIPWVSGGQPDCYSFSDLTKRLGNDAIFCLVSHPIVVVEQRISEPVDVPAEVFRRATSAELYRIWPRANGPLLTALNYGRRRRDFDCSHIFGNLNPLTEVEGEAISFALTNIDVEAQFRALADQWRRETGLLSSSTQKTAHPAYQEIIGMGAAAIPLILREMQERGGHWFAALRAISGENPVPREYAGQIPRIREGWLEWGRLQGHIG